MRGKVKVKVSHRPIAVGTTRVGSLENKHIIVPVLNGAAKGEELALPFICCAQDTIGL